MVGVPVSYSLSDHIGRPDWILNMYTETYLFWLVPFKNNLKATVLPTNSDSDFMLCLQSYQWLIIDISLVY